MARLDALVVGGLRHQVALGIVPRLPAVIEIFAARAFRHFELLEQHGRVGVFEVVARIFLLGLQEDVAVGHLLRPLAAVEVEVVDVLDTLHVHREPLQPVGELARDRPAFEAGDLLKIRELRHLHAVAPALPAEPPGAERRALPVVLDETQIVDRRIDPDRVKRVQVQLLQVRWRRLQDHLELIVVLQPVRVLAVAAVLRAPRGLHVSGVPRFRPERAQGGGRVKRARAHLHVVGLQHHAAVVRPIALQGQDQPLERVPGAHVSGRCFGHGRFLRAAIRGRTLCAAQTQGQAPARAPARRTRLHFGR